MKNMQKILAVSMAMVTVVLLGAPIASGQTVANLVDAVLKEAEVRDWKWGDGGRYEHPTRPQADVVLAQCLQEALGRGEYPEIEAAFMANKAYVEKSIPKAIAFAHEEWNPLESTFITFQLMIRGVDPEWQFGPAPFRWTPRIARRRRGCGVCGKPEGFSKWLLETRSVFRRHGRIHSLMNHAATALLKNRASASAGLMLPIEV